MSLNNVEMDIEMTIMTPIVPHVTPMVTRSTGIKRGRKIGSTSKKLKAFEDNCSAARCVKKPPSQWARSHLGKAGSTRATVNGTLKVDPLQFKVPQLTWMLTCSLCGWWGMRRRTGRACSTSLGVWVSRVY